VAQEIGEWVGGCLSPPFFIMEGEPYRPEMIVWMELPTGLVVGHQLAEAKKPADIGSILLTAMARPIAGPPRRPGRVRVESADLAASVRRAVGDTIQVVVAPTPELNEVLEHMKAGMSGDEVDQSYLEEGRVSVETVAELFHTAELLYRIAPWKTMGNDQVVRVDIPRFGIEGACLSVIGALEESIGLLLFPSLEAFESFASSGQVRKTGPVDLGTMILSLSFERGADMPASMRREIAQYGWPVAGPRAYPRVDHRDRDAVLRPLSERDVKVMAACATSFGVFFTKNRRLFKDDDSGAVCESYSDQDDLTLRFTYPYEAAELFDADEPAPAPRVAAPEIPRNAPCPCGSGRKYKKCHLTEDEAKGRAGLERAAVHEIDERIVGEMQRFASRRFGQAWGGVFDAFQDVEEEIQLASPWSVYCAEVDGRTIVDWYLAEKGKYLPADERGWLEAQRRSWLTIWEITNVNPGHGLHARDLLAGAERSIDEVKGSQMLVARDAVLGRVVDHDGISVFCGLHPHPLAPLDAAEVVRQVRVKLRRKTAPPPERLRDEAIGRFMIKHWEGAVMRQDLRSKVPPQITNTDAEKLSLTTDVFSFPAAKRAEVQRCLMALDGVEEPDGEDPRYVFLRGGGRVRGERTVLAEAILGAAELRLETNSVERADTLRARLEKVCPGILAHERRNQENPIALKLVTAGLPESAAREADESPTAFAAVRAYKRRHYAQWADHPLPALHGKTPREAVRTAEGRAMVEVLLKDFENHESRHPDDARYDFGELRRALGLPA
jgi:hypothetical protein